MKFFSNWKLLLLLIILLASVLRFYQLGNIPSAVHADEADTGYTALSLLKTGNDPYGNKWPVQFQDQGNNYRAPLYTYSVIPSVFILGLNPTSERLPSAIYGVLFVITLFFLIRKYLKSTPVALAGALFAAINPWSILISRTGLEVQLSLFLVTLGILLFEIGRKNGKYLIFSSIIFGLSLFSYHPAKIFVPLIIFALIAFNIKPLLKLKKYVVVYFLIFAIAFAIVAYLAIFGKGASEFHNVSIFNSYDASLAVNSKRTQTNAPLYISSIFTNKPIFYTREFIDKFVGPLSINYLFINGDSNLDKGLGNYGEFNLFLLPLFFVGGYTLYLKKRKFFYFLLSWFLLALIPGAVTKTGYFSYRDVNLLPVPIIFSTVGLKEVIFYFQKKKMRLVLGLYGLFSILCFIFLLYDYFYAYPVFSRDWWSGSQKDALKYVNQNKENYPAIFIQGGADWNVLYAFYYQVDPIKFQNSYKNPILKGNSRINKFDNIYFGDFIDYAGSIDKITFIPSDALVIVPGTYVDPRKPVLTFTGVDGVHINLKAYEIQK